MSAFNSNLPQGHPPVAADGWSRAAISELAEVDRAGYELLCDTTEARLRAGGTLAGIAEGLDASSPVRELVLLNLAQCWLENQPARAVAIEALLADLPELARCPEAVEELSARSGGVEVHPLELISATHQLVKELPHHGLSRVFLVRRVALNRLEFFKAVKPEAAPHPLLGDRLEDEAVRATRIRHPGLVEVFDAGSRSGWRYLLMEYMNGGSLADRLRSGVLPWEIAVRQFALVARALEALHSKAGLAHGDLKPANLLYTRSADEDEQIKIGDFGLCTELHVPHEPALAADTGRPVAFGTPGYLSPELLTHAVEGLATLPFDERVTADVFALGVSLYEALAGVLPYQRPGPADPRGPLVNEYVPVERLVEGVPPVVAYVVRRACATDRAERFTSAAQLARALEGCVPIPMSPLPPAPPNRPGLSPSRRMPLVGWALPAAAALVVGWLVFGPAPEEKPLRSTPAEPRTGVARASTPRATAPAPENPIPPDVRVLTEKKWPREAAVAVHEENQAWWAALRSDPKTAPLAEEQLILLAGLGEQASGFPLLREQPHLAAALALVGNERLGHDMEVALTEGVRNADPGLTNLLVQYPFVTVADDCVVNWNRRRASVQSLMRHGLFGAEQLFLTTRSEAFVGWVDDLLVNQVEMRPQEAANLLAVLFEHHRAVANRVKTNPEFARRLLNDVWPKFLALTNDPNDVQAKRLALYPGIWDVLMLEGGDDLLRRYGELPIDMFSGDDAFPRDGEVRLIALAHLRDGYQPVVEAFADRELRRSTDFHALMKKGLEKKVFAVLCARIVKAKKQASAEAVVAEYALQSRRRLEADVTGEDVDKWTAEVVIPQLIYARLALKLLSGESLYNVEKSAAIRQIAQDVVTYVLPVVPIDPTFVKNFQNGFGVGLEVGNQAVRDLLQREQLESLSRSSYRKLSDGKVDLTLNSTELRQLLKGLGDSLGGRQGDAILDVSSTRALFEGVVRGDAESRRLDLRRVRIYCLSDGRLFALPSAEWFAEQGNPAMRQFFEDRCKKLQRAIGSRADEAEAEAAYRELISAWWLLGATNRLPATR